MCTLVSAVAALALLAGCGSAHVSSARRAAPRSTGGAVGSPRRASAPLPAGGACLDRHTPPLCYSAQQLQNAYGVTSLLGRGITGRGETVALPEVPVAAAAGQASGEPPPSNLRQDIAAYDAKFHLPPPSLTIKSTAGAPTATASPEEVLDAEMVHALAPGAAIVVDLAKSPVTGSGLASAAKLGNIVSASYGKGQECVPSAVLKGQTAALQAARRRHVTVLASAGDSGAAAAHCPSQHDTTRNVGVPSSNPLVTAVGGTVLAASRNGAYHAETVWNDNEHEYTGGSSHPPGSGTLGASGGGFSSLYARPSYQDGVHGIGSHRGVPDVTADAEVVTGPAVVMVLDGHARVRASGGTSAAAPQWAGIVALADQDAHRSLGFINAGLYRIGAGSQYHRAFHDVTTGSNSVVLPNGAKLTGYRAGPGWDPVSGWGSPDAQVLAPLLGREVRSGDGAGLS